MIAKEFKCVVVLVILGDIVAKKRIFIGKKISIASLRGNLLSNHCSSIRIVLPDPKTIENWLLNAAVENDC